MNKFWKIVIAIIFIMTLWFCLEMMHLEGQQKKIDDLKIKMEENEKQYQELHDQIEKELNDGNIL